MSHLDESGVFDDRHILIDACNATLTLQGTDSDRTTCIDFTSAFAAVNFGHRNPAIEDAVRGGADLAAFFYPKEAEQVAASLCRWLGDGATRRVLFQIGGSFAVSTALALGRRARPGRIAAISGGFHGLGVDAFAVTSVQREYALQDTGLADLLDGQVMRLTPGELPSSWGDVSCLIYEPIQGANGYVPLDRDWLRALEASAQAAGVICIADEIQCGFFRHGDFSPALSAGLDPDVLLYGKSLTNGVFPLSAVIYRSELEAFASDRVYLAHTFQTATLGYLAADAVMTFLQNGAMPKLCAGLSARLKGFGDLLVEEDLADDVFATGPTLSLEPLTKPSKDVQRLARRDGVVVIAGGARGERLRVAPPLTVSDEELNSGLEILHTALAGSVTPVLPRQSTPHRL